MGRFLPVWDSLSKGMFAFPQGDEYQVVWVLEAVFFSFTVHLVPPWKQMLCKLLSEGPIVSSCGSTSQWLVIHPWGGEGLNYADERNQANATHRHWLGLEDEDFSIPRGG